LTQDTTLRNRGPNRDVRGELFALTYTDEPVFKEGLKDKIKGARLDQMNFNLFNDFFLNLGKWL
jgi:hypothetical protein